MDYSSLEKNNMNRKLLIAGLLSAFISVAGHAQTTTQTYIDNNLAKARELMRVNHIPASIVLAIAIHESAAGTSKIAKYLNNHFGVKGSNSSTKIKSAYKGYESVSDSYDHFMEFMHNRTSFSKLFDMYDQYDYLSWAKGIQKGGYAHSRLWSSQVIGLIKKYQLYKYDDEPIEMLPALIPASISILSVSKPKRIALSIK